MNAPLPARQIQADVVVVGAGPAGLAAARAAAQSRAVLLLDDNPAAGGQIWRGADESFLERATVAHSATRAAASNHGQRMFGVRVFAGDGNGRVLFAESATEALEVQYNDLVLATGARELFLPFPGWTLPNVMGAGGLQAMVKGGLPIAGKRVVLAGSGPLLLAVADLLQRKGANVVALAEQAPSSAVTWFAVKLLPHPAKLAQAVALRARLLRVPYWTDAWPVECLGEAQLERVAILRHGRRFEIECDYLGCGFGLVPNTELAQQMGCTMRDGFVAVESSQRTSLKHVYCAGEATGIGGLQKSLDEGALAGHMLSSSNGERVRRLGRSRAQSKLFEGALNHAFRLRPELACLAHDDTIVCRCEDVTWGRIREHSVWREAKLHTRCGMGPCQGRVCGAALGVMRGWQVESMREPVFPVRVETLTEAGARPGHGATGVATPKLAQGE